MREGTQVGTIFILISLILLFSALSPTIRAHTPATVRSQVGSDDFTYEFYDSVYNTTTAQGEPISANAKTIQIDYGDNDHFVMNIVDEPNTVLTGFYEINFKFTDRNGTYRHISDTGNSHWISKPDRYMLFQWDGDVNWVKNNIQDFSKNMTGLPFLMYKWLGPTGISDIVIDAPSVSSKNGTKVLNWALQCKQVSALEKPDHTAEWDVNSTFVIRLGFHFFLEGQSAHLKIDMNFSDFSLNPEMVGDPSLLGNMTTGSHIMIFTQKGDLQWVADGVTIEPGELVQIANNATISQANVTISEIKFGQFVEVNDEQNISVQTQVTPEPQWVFNITHYRGLEYMQIFPNLNISSLSTLEMDPEIAVFYAPPAPTIDHPSSITYILQSTGNVITWHPSSKIPARYTISVDGGTPISHGWNGSSITYNIDGLPAGTHTVNCTVYDTEGTSASSTVTVTVQQNYTPLIIAGVGISATVVVVTGAVAYRLKTKK
jgi:hypothetical protein